MQHRFSIGSSLGPFPPPPQNPVLLQICPISSQGCWLVLCLPLRSCRRGYLEIVNPKNAAGFLAQWEGDGVGL